MLFYNRKERNCMTRNSIILLIFAFAVVSCSSLKKMEYATNMGEDSYYKSNYLKFIKIPQYQNDNLDKIILSYKNLPDTMINNSLPSIGMISSKVLINKNGDVSDILLLTRTNSSIDSLIIETIHNSKFKGIKNKKGEFIQYSIIISYSYCNYKFATPLLNGQPVFKNLDSLNICSDKTSIENAAPELLNKPTPVYPTNARKSGIQGRVEIMVIVNKQGFVEYAKPLRSLYTSLDNAAVDAAMSIRIKPAIQRNKKVKIKMTIPYDFALPN